MLHTNSSLNPIFLYHFSLLILLLATRDLTRLGPVCARPCTDIKQMAFPNKDNSQGVTANKIKERQLFETNKPKAGRKPMGKLQTIHVNIFNKIGHCFLNSPKYMYSPTSVSNASLFYIFIHFRGLRINKICSQKIYGWFWKSKSKDLRFLQFTRTLLCL